MPSARGHHRIRRRAVRRPVVLIAALAFATHACAWYAWTPEPKVSDPDADQRFAIPLALGEQRADALHCEAGDCRDVFRITVDRPGRLEVVVTIPPQTTTASLRLVMKGPAQGSGQQTGWGDPPPLRLRTDAVPGPYFALVEGDGGKLRFEIVARLVEATAATE